ncbi:hypothetical protein FA13DRAFT_1799844 [Coprinellus micaceus]|uniref:Uncharacterized protein n=1 Tax=Coprinellus micaceus TaxID=71717 RepID=A0A4Y7SJR5_COPMI|nr:hypothetical protein FA13DRAFT_1799844 [Coprinellus micaceus]
MKYFGFLLASALPLALAYEYRVGVGKDETTGRKGMGFDPSVIHPKPETPSSSNSEAVFIAPSSSFDNPCVSNGGFNSGVFTVSDDLAVDAPGLPISRVLVNGTEPCGSSTRLVVSVTGAVLAVNPTAAQSEVVFKENAALPPKPATTTSRRFFYVRGYGHWYTHGQLRQCQLW